MGWVMSRSRVMCHGRRGGGGGAMREGVKRDKFRPRPVCYVMYCDATLRSRLPPLDIGLH